MAEKLYTIPVNDAFDADSECPVCEMYKDIQNSAVDFVMGTSYMEDDVRMETDKIGFCEKHVPLLYKNQNRLGLGLMMLTHMNKVISEMEKKMEQKIAPPSFFKKQTSSNPVVSYVNELENSCYVCKRMENMYGRYVMTTLYLYEREEGFRAKFAGCKGFCTRHYGLLMEKAPEEISSKRLPEFYQVLNKVYLEGMKRVRDDLEWFTDKFDYRNADKPWGNSKDALIRAIQKSNSVTVEEVKK